MLKFFLTENGNLIYKNFLTTQLQTEYTKNYCSIGKLFKCNSLFMWFNKTNKFVHERIKYFKLAYPKISWIDYHL